MFSRSWSTPVRQILLLVNPCTCLAPAAPFVTIIILHKCVQNTYKFKRIHKITLRKYKQNTA